MPESRIPAERVRRFITAAMERLGLPAADAATVADLMTQAEVQGSDGHGVIRLLPYARRIRAGGINLHPRIRVEKEKAGMALLDGDNGMGHLVMKQATEIAIAKARQCGVAWVGSRLSNHAGPASLYARMALEHDMIGMYFAVGNANHLPPWGGLDMLLSTNPIAVAVPAGQEPPVVLDMATTVAAYGKVKAKAQRGAGANRSPIRSGRTKASCCPSAATRATAWRSSSACWRARSMAPRWAAKWSTSTTTTRASPTRARRSS